MSDDGRALGGLQVLELADEWGELSGKLLADMGAEVIKLEPEGGAPTRHRPPIVRGESLWFRYLNAGKLSVNLPRHEGAAAALLDRLLTRCDGFVVSGAFVRQIDVDALAARHPRLVLAAITPFGRDGPYADWQSDDLVSLALGGVLNICGYDDPGVAPVRPGGGQAYNLGSAMAAIGTMVALLERETSGRGQIVDVSVHDCLGCTTENSNVWWFYLRQLLHRQPGRHASAEPTPPSQVLCGDGRYLNWMPPRAPGEWEAFVEWLEGEGSAEDLADERFAEPRRRLVEGQHVLEVMRRFAKKHTAEDLYHGGQQRGFSWGAVRRPEDLLADEQLQARAFFVRGEDGIVFPGAPYLFSRTPWRGGTRAPAVGEHDDAVLQS